VKRLILCSQVIIPGWYYGCTIQLCCAATHSNPPSQSRWNLPLPFHTFRPEITSWLGSRSPTSRLVSYLIWKLYAEVTTRATRLSLDVLLSDIFSGFDIKLTKIFPNPFVSSQPNFST
jgi:hypothetical protein